jgi:DNA gyrase subunit A
VLEFTEEDLIPHQKVAVTLSTRGFIKRIPSQTYTLQHRGGKGITGMPVRETDAVRLLTVADTHDDLFFFTNRGKVFYLKCHEIPEGASRISKGLAIINLLSILETEKVTAMVATTGLAPDTFMVMATRKGEVKKTSLDKFGSVRSSGLIAMDLAEGDELVSVSLVTDKDDVIMVTQKGQSIRFAVSSLRASSRTSGGVRAMRLPEGDSIVSMDRAITDGFLLAVTASGYGKITPVNEYPVQHRAGSGVRTFKVVEKTGDVTAARVVTLSEQVMLISAGGMITFTPVKEKDPRQGITLQGRSTQGVRVMSLDPGDKLVAITSFESTV